MRRIGEILQSEFDWTRAEIDQAARSQASAAASERFGYYCRQVRADNPSAAYHVQLALQRQEAEARSGTPALSGVEDPALQFDRLEYAELGVNLRWERADILKRIREDAIEFMDLMLKHKMFHRARKIPVPDKKKKGKDKKDKKGGEK